MALSLFSQLLLFLRARWLLSSDRVGQADSEAVSTAWHGEFTAEAVCPLQGKDKQMNESSSDPPSAMSAQCLKKSLNNWAPWVASPFQVMTVQKPFALSCSRHGTEQVFVGPHQSLVYSQYCPADTGSSEEHFLLTEGRSLYYLSD